MTLPPPPPPEAFEDFEAAPRAPRRRRGWKILAIALGGVVLLVLVVAMGLGLAIDRGLLPGTEVVEGTELPDRAWRMLLEEGVVESDEEVILYYCDGFLSFREDGNLFTDRRVISYWEGVGDRLEIEQAHYAEIGDLELEEADSPMESATVWIHRRDGSLFELLVGWGDDGARFHQRLVDTWTARRGGE